MQLELGTKAEDSCILDRSTAFPAVGWIAPTRITVPTQGRGLGRSSPKEMYNMRATLAAAPKLGSYIKEVLRIRSELADYLWSGRFRDGLGATLGGETDGVLYGVHVNRKNGKKAVVLMNTSESNRG